MALEVLQLTAGDPGGKDKFDAYGFQALTVEGEEEQKLRREAACWSLVLDREETRDHDEYGKESWSTLHRETPFLEAEGKLILWQGKLLGYRHRDAIFFVATGKTVGRVQYKLWEESTSRQDSYEYEEWSIRKTQVSEVSAYYEEVDGNPHHTVTAFDPKAEHITLHPDTRRILAPNVEPQYRNVGLEQHAKMHLALRSIVIPAGVEEIEAGVFLGCDDLESITVKEGNPHFHAAGNCLIQTKEKILVAGCKTSVLPRDGSIETVEKDAFSYKQKLVGIDLPEGVKVLGNKAFLATFLDWIVLPRSLEEIQYDVFTYCSGMTIYYKGTPEEMKRIKKDTFFVDRYYGNATRFYYSEEIPTEKGNFWHYGENGEVLKW